MSNVTLFGFPRSTFVKVVGLILTARDVDYRFHDTEDEMYLPIHLERHPFGRVPVLQHDDFMLYETNAIAAYVDDVFPGPKLTPTDARKRARMNQWIGNLNWYFYPEMIYHRTNGTCTRSLASRATTRLCSEPCQGSFEPWKLWKKSCRITGRSW
jgi:glutathione S-transferase